MDGSQSSVSKSQDDVNAAFAWVAKALAERQAVVDAFVERMTGKKAERRTSFRGAMVPARIADDDEEELNKDADVDVDDDENQDADADEDTDEDADEDENADENADADERRGEGEEEEDRKIARKVKPKRAAGLLARWCAFACSSQITQAETALEHGTSTRAAAGRRGRPEQRLRGADTRSDFVVSAGHERSRHSHRVS